jgi:hypothetical protein
MKMKLVGGRQWNSTISVPGLALSSNTLRTIQPIFFMSVGGVIDLTVSFINRMLPELEAAKDGEGSLSREQLAEAAHKLCDFHRLLNHRHKNASVEQL